MAHDSCSRTGGHDGRSFLANRHADGPASAVLPKAEGQAPVDGGRVLSGTIHVKKNGLQWKDAPSVYCPHKTLYNIRWSRMGVFGLTFLELAQPGTVAMLLMMFSCSVVERSCVLFIILFS